MNKRYPRYSCFGFTDFSLIPANAHHRNSRASNRQGFANIKGNKKGRE